MKVSKGKFARLIAVAISLAMLASFIPAMNVAASNIVITGTVHGAVRTNAVSPPALSSGHIALAGELVYVQWAVTTANIGWNTIQARLEYDATRFEPANHPTAGQPFGAANQSHHATIPRQGGDVVRAWIADDDVNNGTHDWEIDLSFSAGRAIGAPAVTILGPKDFNATGPLFQAVFRVRADATPGDATFNLGFGGTEAFVTAANVSVLGSTSFNNPTVTVIAAGNPARALQSATANGSAAVTTTQVTLNFDGDPGVVAASNIAITGGGSSVTVNSIASGANANQRIANISGTWSDNANVTVTASGTTATANLSGTANAILRSFAAPPDTPVTFTGITPNGNASTTTTQITLNFTGGIPNTLTAANLTLNIGGVNRTISSYNANTGVITAFTPPVTAAGNATVTITNLNPTGFIITNNSQTAAVSLRPPADLTALRLLITNTPATVTNAHAANNARLTAARVMADRVANGTGANLNANAETAQVINADMVLVNAYARALASVTP
jgi:hypothetical protein